MLFFKMIHSNEILNSPENRNLDPVCYHLLYLTIYLLLLISHAVLCIVQCTVYTVQCKCKSTPH